MKSLLVKINNKLNAQGGFFKAVSVLVGGTAFAQVIGLICLPILTRLYSPEDYSVLGVYIAIVSILSVIACLRLEIAIPIPDSDREAKDLLLLAFIINIVFIVFLYILLALLHPFLEGFHVIQQLSFWIWFIPIGVLLSGIYSTLQYWSTRKKRFREIAKTRMTQAISGNGASLVVGATSGSFGGLILGQLFSFGGGLLKLSISAYKDLKEVKENSNLKLTLYKYKDFPKYSTFEALANTSAIQLPLIIIAYFLLGPEVGFLMLAMKVLGIPMGLIGSAMSQVYLSHAPKYHQDCKLYEYTLDVIKKILKITFIPFFILALISPYIFGIVLGEQWSEVGYYILAMIPWYFMQILSSPVSMSLHAIGEQKKALYLQILGFVMRVLILILIAMYQTNWIIFYYVLSGFMFYAIYLIVILKALKAYERK
ncbi:oligosaccharide flippase family protein [Acinetobacter sp. ACNIH1]|uniref:oligosaccharide flippase family protein n=1 Tax=Acinetobacter sp. ACNIH1 TaxID=1636603 RepID=UPI000CDC9BB3|nr:oligosaccharide flippase family protein [Acinetobacter sp. ACNIH1]AUX90979.1 polysaccharide biosynthesis protein [Acinetobacter sp. ACNIH1]